MSQIKIIRNNNLVYAGNILDIPIKKEYIIKKSIEVFDDDDPCIIHQSYVIKMFVDELLEKTNLKILGKVDLTSFTELDFLDFNLEGSVIYYD